MSEEWREFARCKNTNPHLFFPPTNDLVGKSVKHINNMPHVKAVIEKFCDNCPVRQPCLEDGLKNSQYLQIRGGTYLPLKYGRHLRRSL